MKIETLGELKNLIDKLYTEVSDPDVKICLSNRFQEFELDSEITVINDTVVIPCYETGSALKGRHRVMGKE
jgi:hypothetical protein